MWGGFIQVENGANKAVAVFFFGAKPLRHPAKTPGGPGRNGRIVPGCLAENKQGWRL